MLTPLENVSGLDFLILDNASIITTPLQQDRGEDREMKKPNNAKSQLILSLYMFT